MIPAVLKCMRCSREWVADADIEREAWIALQRDFREHQCVTHTDREDGSER